ncbi:MAG: exo-alpha-sialidase [Chloroflexi bacterium]|nr:MAG: exo-alpha-sialidase [Chloroflexota bacterium]
MTRFLTLFACAILVLGAASVAFAQSDTRVSSGSPATPFSENKQNEPALAVDANHPNILAAGSNDELDEEACNAGNDTTCPFTPGIGVSGVYFSFDSGNTWTQPTYTGLSARNCQGLVGNSDPACRPQVGPIGTLPWYFENGLVADGDPALAFGPRRSANGTFSWANGSRLYYANLTSNLGATRTDETFKGFEAIGVSRTDNVVAAAAGDKSAWMPPVIASKQNSTLFADKEQIWADNASSSAFFGNVYICYVAYRGQEKGNAFPSPLVVISSRDGGDTWIQQQVTAAVGNRNNLGRSGCTIRTDSHGVVYVFVATFGLGTPGTGSHVLIQSFDGGLTFTAPRAIFSATDTCMFVDPVLGRCVMDGIAGARDDLSPAPSVDIANGAPTGADATDVIVDAWADGRDGMNHEHVFVSASTDHGATWSASRSIESSGDRGYYAAPAISPNGRDVYVVYNAFTTPFRNNTTDPRALVGVVKHADVSTSGAVGAFTELHRGTPGDPRGSSQNNLVGEFLGDYVYAVATRTYGTGVWNDTRNAADCPAIDAWRMALRTGDTSVPRPAPQQDCAPTWGNSDIFGGSFPDPTP